MTPEQIDKALDVGLVALQFIMYGCSALMAVLFVINTATGWNSYIELVAMVVYLVCAIFLSIFFVYLKKISQVGGIS